MALAGVGRARRGWAECGRGEGTLGVGLGEWLSGGAWLCSWLGLGWVRVWLSGWVARALHLGWVWHGRGVVLQLGWAGLGRAGCDRMGAHQEEVAVLGRAILG